MRKVLQFIITSLCFAAALSLYWFWSAGELRDALAEWRRQQAAKGLQVAYRDPVIDGFPLTLQLSVSQPSIVAAGIWQWQGPPVSGQTKLYNPQRITIAAPGRHRITFTKSGSRRWVDINAQGANGELGLDGAGRLVSASLQLDGVSATTARQMKLSADQLSSSVVLSEQEDVVPAPLHSIRISVQNLVLPKAALRPFSEEIAGLDIQGRLFGWTSDKWSPSALARWRDLGGRLEIATLSLAWDSLAVSASGRLALDQELRPEGVLDAWWRGLSETIDRLATAKVLKAEAVLALKIGLLALPTRTAADGAKEVSLPITFEGGQLYLGPIPVTSLRPLS
jgi:hypothetical protein